jgi:hypothetical protein
VSGPAPRISSFAPHCDECPLRLTGVEDPDPKVLWRACRCRYHPQCSQCGWPIMDDASRPDHRSLCAACAREDLTRGRPPEDRHELPAFLGALGLAPDMPVTFHLLLGTELDDDWGEYRVERALIPDVTWAHPATDHVVAHPWRVRLPGWDAPQIILRWRQWRVGTPEFLERSWLREGPRWVPRRHVRAVGRLPSRRAIEDFTKLLGDHDELGRRPDDLDRWLETELRPAIRLTIIAGHRPDQNAVAERLGLTLSGLGKKLHHLNTERRRRGRLPVLWRQLVAEIQSSVQREPH